MQADGQLTDASLQAALGIAADAITSAVLAGKGVDSVYASELLLMTARGLQLPSGDATGSSTGRRLLAAPAGYTFAAAGASRLSILDALDSLANLLLPSAGPAVGWISASAEGLSVSVVNRAGQHYADYSLPAGPQATNNTEGTPIQAADPTHTANAVVTIQAAFTPADSTLAIWVQLVQNPALLVSKAPTPTQVDVDAFKAAAWNDTLPPVAPPLLNLTVLTPAVRVKLPSLEREDDAVLPCAAAEGNATVDCSMVIKMPILDPTHVDTSRLLVCLRIDTNGILVAAASPADGWQMYGNYSSDGTLRCATSKQGTYVIAAVDPVDTTSPAVTPEPTAAVNATANYTACNGTREFDSNGTACFNGSVNTTTPDANVTANAIVNATANATVGDGDVLNSTETSTTASNTTDTNSTSPAPEPESPSPSPEPESPSPSPEPAPLEGWQQSSDQLRGLLINLGAVTQCQVSGGVLHVGALRDA